ncbi:MAG: GTP 3',8-cyclase MoaA [bacterium]|nr:GTP 3',8-cyclase MoaA [bacterium]
MSDQYLPSSGDVLEDTFGRNFPYLRLSVTDVCNFRCSYCLPDGYKCTGKPSFLRNDEISRLVNAFADLGTQKIRLTGGEPSVRKDFTQIAQLVSQHPGITQVAFTTNGYRLEKYANQWREAGLTHINISVDSLNSDRFHKITGHNLLSKVRSGIDAALEAGFHRVKINVVLLKGVNDHEVEDFMAWAKGSPLSIRFIELMQTGENLEYFQKYHLSSESIRKKLDQTGWIKKPRAPEAGPAQEYTHPGHQGSIGLIAPYSKDFCKGCNRLRVTSTGCLRLCLFGNQETSLRHFLQKDDQKELLKQLIQNQLTYKRSSHFLHQGDTGLTPHLASIGG